MVFVDNLIRDKQAEETKTKGEIGNYSSGIQSGYYDIGSVPSDYRDEVTQALIERGYKPPITKTEAKEDKELSTLRADIAGYKKLKDIVTIYGDSLDKPTILSEYNRFHSQPGSPWGSYKEQGPELEALFEPTKTKTEKITEADKLTLTKELLNEVSNYKTKDEAMKDFALSQAAMKEAGINPQIILNAINERFPVEQSKGENWIGNLFKKKAESFKKQGQPLSRLNPIGFFMGG